MTIQDYRKQEKRQRAIDSDNLDRMNRMFKTIGIVIALGIATIFVCDIWGLYIVLASRVQ